MKAEDRACGLSRRASLASTVMFRGIDFCLQFKREETEVSVYKRGVFIGMNSGFAGFRSADLTIIHSNTPAATADSAFESLAILIMASPLAKITCS